MIKNRNKREGTRYKAQGVRCKVQCARQKVQGFLLASCTLRLVPDCSPLASVQRGFSLISAIFLLVVIAALGTFAVTLSTNQQQSAALDVWGSRAYQAARAGIEWGAYQELINGSCVAGPQTLAALPNTLAGFTVTVACTSYPSYNEAGNTVNMYQLLSTASQGAVGTPNYVERQMKVTIAK
jgi:MSHA biogenesis protein MshP